MNEKISLNNGKEMPMIGYGVYQITTSITERCVNEALEAEPSIKMFELMCRYLGWINCGKIIANGIPTRGAIKVSKFMKQAYELGKNLE